MADVLRNLGWWVRDYAYALVWQVRAFADRTDPAVYRSGTRIPIVVVPGVYETWRFLQPLIAALHRRGHPVHVIADLHRNSRPVADAAAHVAAYLTAVDLQHVVLLAHSKGGLIGKHVMVFGDAASRVDAMVAVAAPFGGSRYGRVMLSPTLRAFSPLNPMIAALTRETAANARIVSVYGVFDPHIPEGSALAGAKNVVLETGGHFRVLADPRVIAEVVALAG